MLVACAVALAVWSPWLLKNLLLTGNPVYPFFFGGVYWDAWRTWWYGRHGNGLLYTAAWKLLTAPWDATIWGVEGREGYGATIGPLLLGPLPLFFLVWRWMQPDRRCWLWSALAFCGVLYGFWLWGIARTALLLQTRLLFPAFGLLSLTVGAAVEGLRALPRSPMNLGWLTRVIIVVVLMLTLVGMLLYNMRQQPLRVLLGFEKEKDFLARRLGWYYVAVEDVNRELPPDAVVLFLWEPRSYHCQVTCWPDPLLDRWLHTTHVHGYDAGAIADAWTNPPDRGTPSPDSGRRVFGLAPYQNAADVLAGEGLRTKNVAAWLATQNWLDRAHSGRPPGNPDDERWRLHSGDLVVLDEAGTAETPDLLAVRQRCDAAGAKLLLVWDPRQLTAVGPSGAMADITDLSHAC